MNDADQAKEIYLQTTKGCWVYIKGRTFIFKVLQHGKTYSMSFTAQS